VNIRTKEKNERSSSSSSIRGLELVVVYVVYMQFCSSIFLLSSQSLVYLYAIVRVRRA
jgi:hypothetical protein